MPNTEKIGHEVQTLYEKKFTYRDKINQLGIVIASFRKMRGMTQEQLSEKAGISRTFLSSIEAPGTSRAFSLEVLYALADALNVKPGDLLNFADDSERLIEK